MHVNLIYIFAFKDGTAVIACFNVISEMGLGKDVRDLMLMKVKQGWEGVKAVQLSRFLSLALRNSHLFFSRRYDSSVFSLNIVFQWLKQP